MHCACSILSHVACPVLHFSPTFSHKRHGFRKRKHWTFNLCLEFSDNCCQRLFHSKKKWAVYDRKCILVFMQNTLYSGPMLGKLELRDRFSKNPHILWKFVEWEPSCSMRTDRHDEATSRLRTRLRKINEALHSADSVSLRGQCQSQSSDFFDWDRQVVSLSVTLNIMCDI